MNNKKTRVFLTVLAVVLAIALAAGVGVLIYLLRNPQTPDATQPQGTVGITEATEPAGNATDSISTVPSDDPGEVPPETEPTVAAKDDLEIETPYAVLYYPGEWKDFLQVKTEGDTYTFTSVLSEEKQQTLFSLTFGGSEEGALGLLCCADGKKVPLHVESYKYEPDDSWTDREVNIVFTMMDHLNDILSKLELEPVQEPNQPTSPAPDEGEREAMGIDTAYCQLMYPAQWAQYLRLDAKQDSVAFYAANSEGEKILLFTVCFGTDQGTPVKSIVGYEGATVEVRLIMAELRFDSTWSEDDQRIASAMQEDVNFLLNGL